MEIVIIGGIAAGASIAAKARRTNRQANITIIEKEDFVSFGACGLPYYIGGKFNDSNEMFARSVEDTKNSGINVLTKHEVVSIDFDEKSLHIKNLQNEESFTKKYDKLAIATGAKPIVMGDGVESSNVFTSTKLEDAEGIKKQLKESEKIYVIGSGFIGLEVAEQIASLGKKVTVVQRSNLLMSNIYDEEISLKLREALEEYGVDFLDGHSYKGFITEDNKAIKMVTDKDEFEMDMAILSIGFRPNTGFIEDERLKKLKNGAIIIDKTGKTSIEDVYAAGDCATVYSIQQENYYAPMATYANKMGRIIGENIVSDKNIEYQGALGSSSLKVGEYGAGVTGLTENKAKEMGLNIKTSFIKDKNQTSYYPGQEDIFIKLVYDAETRIILGGQVFGKKGAVERLSALTLAVYSKITVDELGMMDFAYSPPFARTWEALNIAGNASK